MQRDADRPADLSRVGYAQCWEDADVLLEGLDVQPGEVCLSIASAGDNTLALLTRDPARVIALDRSAPQLACLELRVAAYRELDHGELLELIGSRPSGQRGNLYQRCRGRLSSAARDFWDARPLAIAGGIGSAGRFEHYLGLFRQRVLPLIHSRRTIERLLLAKSLEERLAFYEQEWNTRRWRLLFQLFFSRWTMARLGRDPAFLRYVEGDVALRLLERVRHALTDLDPAGNPYVEWILHGRHGGALPLALRPENFGLIRARIDRLEWHCESLEGYLERPDQPRIDRFNLSDIFEYLSPEDYERLLGRLHHAGRRGGRLAYWNLLVPRQRPESLADRLKPLTSLATRLHGVDQAFFYSAFVVEEIL